MGKFFSLWLLLVVACGTDELEPLPVDSGLECSDPLSAPLTEGGVGGMDGSVAPLDGGAAAGGCPSGQVCTRGRCYPRCMPGLGQCAQGFRCGDEGVCVPGDAPDTGPRDAGMVDTAVPDPCTGVTCPMETPVCVGGMCYQCGAMDMAQCGGAATVCDVARGTCRAFEEATCAPCNVTADCGTTRMCREIDVGDLAGAERVCLDVCTSGTCPKGFSCDVTANLCVPVLNSCTLVRNATLRTACMADADCVPIGGSVPPGVCEGAMPAAMVPGACRAACGMDQDCTGEATCVDQFCVGA